MLPFCPGFFCLYSEKGHERGTPSKIIQNSEEKKDKRKLVTVKKKATCQRQRSWVSPFRSRGKALCRQEGPTFLLQHLLGLNPLCLLH